jgi:hypothetical protein
VITDTDVIAYTVFVGNVSAGSDTTVIIGTKLPKTSPRGDVFLGVIADDLDQVPEYDEDDNTAYRPLSYQVPLIYAVRDVPGDQGGNVYLSWYSSPLDLPEAGGQITQYSVWRAIAAAEALAMIEDQSVKLFEAGAPLAADSRGVLRVENIAGQTFFWHPIDTTGAYHLDAYGYVEPTMFDSTGAGWEYNYYQVIAHTSDELVFYISAPDSGYSVDDLAPAMPQNLAGTQTEPTGLQITWDPNIEPDLSNYAVYRGTDPDFDPDPGRLIGTPLDPGLFDDDWRWDGGFYYKVAAIDVHGNVSVFATMGPDLVTGVVQTGVPAVSYLGQNRPNPFGAQTRIEYGLVEDGDVSITIYDVKGRLVRSLVNGTRAAKHHSVVWDGRDNTGRVVAGGIYFCRMEAGPFVQTKKLTVLR